VAPFVSSNIIIDLRNAKGGLRFLQHLIIDNMFNDLSPVPQSLDIFAIAPNLYVVDIRKRVSPVPKLPLRVLHLRWSLKLYYGLQLLHHCRGCSVAQSYYTMMWPRIRFLAQWFITQIFANSLSAPQTPTPFLTTSRCPLSLTSLAVSYRNNTTCEGSLHGRSRTIRWMSVFPGEHSGIFQRLDNSTQRGWV
jgi:hypothetical protein